MVDELICPDCGGVVGATENSAAGAPCRCFTSSSSSLSGGTLSGGTLSGTATLSAEGGGSSVVTDRLPAEAAPPKVCRLCGTDLTGRKRYKDNSGYYCADCNHKQTLDDHQGRVRCRACGHLVKAESLTDYEGTRMCPTCYGERMDLKKHRIQKIGFKGARTREDFRQVLIVVYVLLGLVGIILIGVVVNHFRGH